MSRRRAQQGFALIHAMMFLLLTTSTVMVVSSFRIARTRALQAEILGVQARYAAEAGAALALHALKGGESTPSEGRLGRASWSVELERDSGGAFSLVATGRCGAIQRSVRVQGSVRGGQILVRSWH